MSNPLPGSGTDDGSWGRLALTRDNNRHRTFFADEDYHFHLEWVPAE